MNVRKGTTMSAKTVNRVLYVEDEPNIRAVGIFALEEVGGFIVESAESGQDALNKAGAFDPDLILLDVMMPGMDGIATFKALRASDATSRIPVIFMTAKVQPHEVQGYKDLGAIAVIAKPFDPVSLPDEVRALWVRQGDPR
jgi:two-component system, OmpR family, response regulator